jgi:hypothetical protein
MKRRLFVLLVLAVLTIVPVMAQDSILNIVQFNKFSFGYDSAAATGVNIYQFPGDPVELEYPGGPQPPYTSFLLYNQLPVPEYPQAAGSVAEIRVYEVERLPGYTFHEQRYQELMTMLTERPDLTPYMQVPGDMAVMIELPFLPVYPAAQVIRAQVKYVETDVVQGISFVTAFRQDVSPFMAGEFLYTFQGISKDGSRYVSVIAPISTALFPSEMPAQFDYEAFSATYATYLAESINTLNTATPEDFTPSPVTFEVLLQTFAFEE